jgi:acetyl esterase/lipase
MRSLELPAQMNRCLQIFIVSLLDDSTVSVTHEIQGLPSALVIAAENGPVRDEGDGYAHKLIGTDMADAVIRYDGRAI